MCNQSSLNYSFSGAYQRSVDDKGRLSVPAAFLGSIRKIEGLDNRERISLYGKPIPDFMKGEIKETNGGLYVFELVPGRYMRDVITEKYLTIQEPSIASLKLCSAYRLLRTDQQGRLTIPFKLRGGRDFVIASGTPNILIIADADDYNKHLKELTGVEPVK
ncbi:MAG: hypothetical protein JW716_00685 [Candidatus Aenigmarchaeota archaeon]|nr:hypothetical protein [Candidatus Aenigmarchaeota archaeon]